MSVIQITVHKSSNLDEAIAEAVLIKLGLKDAQIRKEFVDTYGYTNLAEFFKKVLNDPKNAKAYANIAKAVKQSGKSMFGFEVPDKLISDVKEFFAVLENKYSDRFKDGSKQLSSAVNEATTGVKKNQSEAFDDLDKGLGRTVGGLWNSMTTPVGSNEFRTGTRDVRDGLYQFGGGIFKYNIQTPLDAGLMFIGGEVDRNQTLIGIENIGRSLNLVERRILDDVFGSSLVLEVIKIKQGYAGIYSVGDDGGFTLLNNNRAITRGNTIYMKNATVGSTSWKSTLVHEATHVWQNQNGGTDYMSEALYAQLFGDGYDYQKGVKDGKNWGMLNPEQQARLIQVAYDGGYFQNQNFVDEFGIKRPDLTKYMQNVLPQLRAGQGAT